jgi:hypothetical protein
MVELDRIIIGHKKLELINPNWMIMTGSFGNKNMLFSLFPWMGALATEDTSIIKHN